jgi:putative serine protease PepD
VPPDSGYAGPGPVGGGRAGDDTGGEGQPETISDPWWSAPPPGYPSAPPNGGSPFGGSPYDAAPYGGAPYGGSPYGPPYESPPHPASSQWRDNRPGWVALALAAAVAALLGGTIGGAIVHSADGSNQIVAPHTVTIGSSQGAGPAIERPPGSVANVAAKILPSVVSIEVKIGAGGDTGSGIVISSAGYVLTNNHVVAAAVPTGGTLSVVFPDKHKATGTIVGRDPISDLAVVKVNNVQNLQPAVLGSSGSLAVGDPVIAVGSPLGLAGTVTTGIISALDRPVAAGDSTSGADDVIDAIQTDAAINPGNSGGPLVDLSGAVVGVNSAIATLSGGTLADSQSGNIGLGFAIPIDQAKRIAAEIIKQGFATHAIIGVHLDPRYNGNGAKIGGPAAQGAAVSPGGPAAKAGLKAGDIIVEADGVVVTTPEELIVAIRKNVPGYHLRIVYLRDGKRRTTTVILGSAKSV